MNADRDDSDVLNQLDNLLNLGNQAWLLGAGTSYDSGIPLMWGLTHRVKSAIDDEKHKEAINTICDDLRDNCHIEHILSHLADCRAITERKKQKIVAFGQHTFTIEDMDKLHQSLLDLIARTVRWGYIAGDGKKKEVVGTYEEPVVVIDNQKQFIESIFLHRQKNITERRSPVRFFTTNYDTLIEDALSLCCVPYWDGFKGGAIAYRSQQYGDPDCLDGSRAQVVKLHGSIDWHLDSTGKIWRIRDNDRYPERTNRVVIYPQATKYIATQRDPFACQFEIFRRTLSSRDENVLAIVGYSFGDEHINQEIKLAMDASGNKTTIIAFVKEKLSIPEDWLSGAWSKRLYIVCESGVYVGGNPPVARPSKSKRHDWWMFHQVSKLLKSGPGACLK